MFKQMTDMEPYITYQNKSLRDKLLPLEVMAPVLFNINVTHAEHKKCAPVRLVEKPKLKWLDPMRNLLTNIIPTEDEIFSAQASKPNATLEPFMRLTCLRCKVTLDSGTLRLWVPGYLQRYTQT